MERSNNEVFSSDLPYLFIEFCADKDLKSGMNLVEDTFYQYPKDPEGITYNILMGLIESCSGAEEFFYKYLLKHLELLYLEWARSQA